MCLSKPVMVILEWNAKKDRVSKSFCLQEIYFKFKEPSKKIETNKTQLNALKQHSKNAIKPNKTRNFFLVTNLTKVFDNLSTSLIVTGRTYKVFFPVELSG
jgi:hypothetical protein